MMRRQIAYDRSEMMAANPGCIPPPMVAIAPPVMGEPRLPLSRPWMRGNWGGYDIPPEQMMAPGVGMGMGGVVGVGVGVDMDPGMHLEREGVPMGEEGMPDPHMAGISGQADQKRHFNRNGRNQDQYDHHRHHRDASGHGMINGHGPWDERNQPVGYGHGSQQQQHWEGGSQPYQKSGTRSDGDGDRERRRRSTGSSNRDKALSRKEGEHRHRNHHRRHSSHRHTHHHLRDGSSGDHRSQRESTHDASPSKYEPTIVTQTEYQEEGGKSLLGRLFGRRG